LAHHYFTLVLFPEAPPPLEEHVPEQLESPPEEENVIEEVYNPPEHEDSFEEEEERDGEVVDVVPNSSQAMAVDSGSTTNQEEAPKKSYASIVSFCFEYVLGFEIASLS